MSLKNFVPTASLLLLSGLALAGGWDVGPFDNDDALDWVWELTESDDLSAVDYALDAVSESPAYIEAPTASMAIAAAEVLAALKGNARDGLPDEVAGWVESHDLDVNEELAGKARRAVKLIMDDETSELAQLWADSPELANAWRSDLEGLLDRLQ